MNINKLDFNHFLALSLWHYCLHFYPKTICANSKQLFLIQKIFIKNPIMPKLTQDQNWITKDHKEQNF